MSEDNVEARATELGWSPKDKFRGDPEKWVDATTFVERGETMLPIIKAENKKLKGELTELRQIVESGQASMEQFKKYQEEETARRVVIAVEKEKAKMVEARREGNIDAEIEAQTAITKLQAAPPKTNGEAKGPTKDAPQEPWFKQWIEDNEWYGKDIEKSEFATVVGRTLKREGSTLTERAFLDEISKRVQAKYPESNPRRESPGKAEGSRAGASSSSDSHTYNDLPADVKAVCDKWNDKLVGPNKTYKTVKEWREKYVKDYYAE